MSEPAAARRPLHPLTHGMPRAFWILFAGMLVNRTGTFVMPFLALYLTRVRGCTVTQAGFVAALYGAGAAVASPVGGFLADRFGRRGTMLFALGAGGIGMIAMGFLRPIALIAPAAFTVALLGEMYRPAMQAAVVDLVPPADRVRAMGLIYWAINLGVAIGVSVGGLLATVSYTLLFVGDGLTTLLFAALVWRALGETRVPSARPATAGGAAAHLGDFLVAFRDPPFVAFLALNVVVFTIFMQHTSTLALDMGAHGLSPAVFGAVIAINGGLIVLVQPFLGPWLARRDLSRVMAAGTALVACGFGLNALARVAPVYAAAVAVWTVGEIGVLPVAGAIVADLARPESRGRYQGAHGLSFGIAGILAPLAGTAVYQRFGAGVLWTGCMVAGLAVAAVHLAWAPRLTRLRAARVAAASAPAH